jgi:hypothetical protein
MIRSQVARLLGVLGCGRSVLGVPRLSFLYGIGNHANSAVLVAGSTLALA